MTPTNKARSSPSSAGSTSWATRATTRPTRSRWMRCTATSAAGRPIPASARRSATMPAITAYNPLAREPAGNAFSSSASQTYVSPIVSGCQKNFIIFISNGPRRATNCERARARRKLRSRAVGNKSRRRSLRSRRAASRASVRRIREVHVDRPTVRPASTACRTSSPTRSMCCRAYDRAGPDHDRADEEHGRTTARAATSRSTDRQHQRSSRTPCAPSSRKSRR